MSDQTSVRRTRHRHGAGAHAAKPASGAAVLGGLCLLAIGPVASAEAADLAPEPLAVSYVGICSAAGEGYYLVPGTTSCLRVHGKVRAEYQGLWASGKATPAARQLNATNWLSRGYIYVDSVSDSGLGPVSTRFEAYWTYDSLGPHALDVDYAQIAYAGFTFGRGESFYDAANYLTWGDVFTPGQSDTKINRAAYTATLAQGLSLSLSAEDTTERQLAIAFYPGGAVPPSAARLRTGIAFGPRDNGYGGSKWPDGVARLKLDRPWGSAQVMGATHQVYAAYNDHPGSDGVTPDGGLGWAAGAGLTAHLLHKVTAVATGTYFVGAAAYANSNWFALPGENPLAFDAAYDPASGDLDLSTGYSVSGGLGIDVRSANLAVQAAWSRFENPVLGRVSGGAESANFTQYDLQVALTYTVVKNFTLGLSGEYQYLDHEDPSIATEQQLATLFRVERWF